jgi:hypothetical protein
MGVESKGMLEAGMRVQRELYALERSLGQHLPQLRPSQRVGLALWVLGTVLAQSGCQTAVMSALVGLGEQPHAIRQRLREWLYDGQDRASPCRVELDVSACMAPLLGWLLSWWQGREVALAIDATMHGEKLTALVVSVLYRGCAIPVAWHILPANKPGEWMGPILGLLARLAPAVPNTMQVLVLADRGLYSPRLWDAIVAQGWHPLLRIRRHYTFRPRHGRRCRADAWAQMETAWVGQGCLAKRQDRRREVTLIVVWVAGQAEPWVLITNLPPTEVGVSWYALRAWTELGFRALKGVGWQWEHTRRVDPARVARFWLVLAVASLYTLSCGTRVEEAQLAGLPPARMRTPPSRSRRTRPRLISVFRQGLLCFTRLLLSARIWKSLWLLPEPWPDPPPGLTIRLAPLACAP